MECLRFPLKRRDHSCNCKIESLGMEWCLVVDSWFLSQRVDRLPFPFWSSCAASAVIANRAADSGNPMIQNMFTVLLIKGWAKIWRVVYDGEPYQRVHLIVVEHTVIQINTKITFHDRLRVNSQLQVTKIFVVGWRETALECLSAILRILVVRWNRQNRAASRRNSTVRCC